MSPGPARRRTRKRALDPADVVASFDSATVLQAGLAAALRGRAFPNLGNGAAAGAAVRAAGTLPWPVLRRLYTRIGASEALDAARLGEVDLAAVAGWLAGGYPRRRYPAVLVGSSNGALAHLAAAMGVPWLPGTVLVPVARVGDPHSPADALRFGQQVAPALLARNPDVVLHHMHDQVQDELMVARMTYSVRSGRPCHRPTPASSPHPSPRARRWSWSRTAPAGRWCASPSGTSSRSVLRAASSRATTSAGRTPPDPTTRHPRPSGAPTPAWVPRSSIGAPRTATPCTG